ncbi:MAG TPA: hypothetical protein PK993_00085 [Clostridia bacterium]|nr:hypothetical protein [Clostridia bacterium]
MNKKIIIISIIIAIVLIAAGVGGWFIWNSQQNKENNTVEKEDNTSKTNTTQNTVTDNKNDTTSKEDEDTTNINDSKEVAAIKKALKDEEWVKDNVSLKDGNILSENQTQKHTFIVLYDDAKKPFVIVKALREEGTKKIMQAYVVTYTDNKVVAKEIAKDYIFGNESINTDIKVETSKALVNYYTYLGKGEESFIYSIKNGNPEFVDIYGYYKESLDDKSIYFKEHYSKEVSTISQSEYNSIKDKYKSTAYNRITIQLTSQNIDKYIK